MLARGASEGRCVIVVNPYLSAVLANDPQWLWIKVDLIERRALSSDIARLTHAWLCSWLRPGETQVIGREALGAHVWRMPAASPSRARARATELRLALQAIGGLPGWRVAPTRRDQWAVRRRRDPGQRRRFVRRPRRRAQRHHPSPTSPTINSEITNIPHMGSMESDRWVIWRAGDSRNLLCRRACRLSGPLSTGPPQRGWERRAVRAALQCAPYRPTGDRRPDGGGQPSNPPHTPRQAPSLPPPDRTWAHTGGGQRAPRGHLRVAPGGGFGDSGFGRRDSPGCERGA